MAIEEATFCMGDFWLSACDGSRVDPGEQEEVCRFLRLIFPKETSSSIFGTSSEEIEVTVVCMEDFWLSECDGSKVDTRERDEVCRFLRLIFPKMTSLSLSGTSSEQIEVTSVCKEDFWLSEFDGSKVDPRECDDVCRFLELVFSKVPSLSASGTSSEEIMLAAAFMEDFLL